MVCSRCEGEHAGTLDTGAPVFGQSPPRLAVAGVVPGPESRQQAQLAAQMLRARVGDWTTTTTTTTTTIRKR